MSTTLQGRRLTLADLNPRKPAAPAPRFVSRKPWLLQPPPILVEPLPPPPVLSNKQAKAKLYWERRALVREQLELRKPEIDALTAALVELYPGAFSTPVRPLKIGITEDILRDLGCDKQVLELVMHAWCSSVTYRNALANQRVRFGLDGFGAGTVEPRDAPRTKGITMPAINLSAKALKVTTIIDGAALAGLSIPDSVSRVPVKVQIGGQHFTADFAAKSVRKVIAAIREHGAEQIAVLVQGKLTGNVIEDAGIAANVKTPKPAG